MSEPQVRAIDMACADFSGSEYRLMRSSELPEAASVTNEVIGANIRAKV